MELRDALAEARDLVIVYVLPDNQVNEKTGRFIDDMGLRGRVTFAMDRGSAAIDRLGIRRPDPEPMEAGVPHPTTYLLDRDGIVRFVDVRSNYHLWLDAQTLIDALEEIP